MDEQQAAAQEAIKRLMASQDQTRRSTGLGSLILFVFLLTVACCSCSAFALAVANAGRVWGGW